MMEETKDKPIAIVKSPCVDSHERPGSGFSLAEIKAAGKTIMFLKQLNIKIDFLRKSIHNENVELLQSLQLAKKKTKKRQPYTPKEKKIKARPFKPKKKMKPAKVEKAAGKVSKEKAPTKKPIAKVSAKAETEEIVLTQLSLKSSMKSELLQ